MSDQKADMDLLEKLNVAAAATFARSLRLEVLRSVKRGSSMEEATRAHVDPLIELLTNAMLTAYLYGVRRTRLNAGPYMRKTLATTATDVYSGAVEYARSRLQLTPEQLASISQTVSREAARVAVGFDDVVNKRLLEASAKIIEESRHVQHGMQAMKTAFAHAGIDPDGLKNSLVETLVRTQSMMGYNAGRWAAGMDPAISEILWGYEYVAVVDGRTRYEHEAEHGVKRPKDDPYWASWWPPNGYNCRCTTIEVFVGEPDAEATPLTETAEVDGVTVLRVPDKGFAFHPAQIMPDVPKPSAVPLTPEPVPAAVTAQPLQGQTLAEKLAGWKDGDDVAAQIAKLGDDAEYAKHAARVEQLRKKLENAATGKIEMLLEMDLYVATLERESCAAVKAHPLLATTQSASLVGTWPAKTKWSQHVAQTAEAWLNRVVSDLAVSNGKLSVSYKTQLGVRSAYIAEENKIGVSKYASVASVVHEWGHAIEHSRPSVGQACREFVSTRTHGEPPTKLAAKFPGKTFKPYEYGKKDRWEAIFGEESPRAYYVGKTYPNGATEALSMGMEQMYRDAIHFAKVDPEYFKLVLAAMRGVL